MELPPYQRDELLVAHRQIIEQLGVAKTPKERLRPGQERGRAKRYGKLDSPDSGQTSALVSPPPSREEEEALRRKHGAAPGTRNLYSDQTLKQSQVDELVKIKDKATQEQVAKAVAGKTVIETREGRAGGATSA